MQAVMAKPPHILERAFELAQSGAFENITAIRLQLAREGFAAVSSQMSGLALTRQLRAMCHAARGGLQAKETSGHE